MFLREITHENIQYYFSFLLYNVKETDFFVLL